jgi:hypothetical protein
MKIIILLAASALIANLCASAPLRDAPPDPADPALRAPAPLREIDADDADTQAAIEGAFGGPLARAAARAEATRTNAMRRPVRVASRDLVAGQLVERLSDGSIRTAPLRTLTTARVTPSGRDQLEAETRALADRLGADPADPRAAAAALAKHRVDLDNLEAEAAKSKGKSGALGALAGAALTLASRRLAKGKA